MKLCVCVSQLKHSKSHSSVRHSSYALLSDNSQAAGEAFAVTVFSTIQEKFIMKGLMYVEQVE